MSYLLLGIKNNAERWHAIEVKSQTFISLKLGVCLQVCVSFYTCNLSVLSHRASFVSWLRQNAKFLKSFWRLHLKNCGTSVDKYLYVTFNIFV